MVYREAAEDVAGLMSISDSQSLLDLLRLAVREEHEKQTVRFSYDTPRADVVEAVEGLWRELLLGESREPDQPADGAAEETAGEAEELPGSAAGPPASGDGDPDGEAPPQDGGQPPDQGEASPVSGAAGEEIPVSGEADAPEDPEEASPEVPPCPWTIRFYPDRETAGEAAASPAVSLSSIYPGPSSPPPASPAVPQGGSCSLSPDRPAESPAPWAARGW